MGRTAAIIWHALSSLVAGALYVVFVLPRSFELMGDITHTVGTALRIVAGVVIALAALPVVFTWLRTRKPEFGSPLLALRLRIWSVVAHVLAGVLIVGTAISEIWLNLDTVGQWLFGIYGAAAAIAVLGIFAFYLSFVAELPPPPPKPLKPKKPKKARRRVRRKRGAEEAAEAPAEAETEEAEQTEAADDSEQATETVATTATEPESTAEEPEPAAEETVEAEASGARLRNRRPTGKASRRRGRSRGSVTVDD